MKKTLLISTALLLAACSASPPNLIHSNQPILNLEAPLENKVDVRLQADEAHVKNISSQAFTLAYYLYWYDKNGVTQPFSLTQEYQRATLLLQPQQTAAIPLAKPSAASHQYRLYLRAK